MSRKINIKKRRNFSQPEIGNRHTRSDDVASRLQVSDLYKSDLQVSSQFANDLMWKKLKFLCINKVNWWFLDLKTLQVFFKNRGEILILKKMLYFLSFYSMFQDISSKKNWNFIRKSSRSENFWLWDAFWSIIYKICENQQF